jgi:hypothetical protein
MSQMTESVLQWLLDGDPAIRWQTMRDLKDATDRTVLREQMAGWA